MLISVLIFIAVLAVLVLAHEWGHFIVARKNGIKVEEFGFGFPPRIFGVQVLSGKKISKLKGPENIAVDVQTDTLEDGSKVITETITDTVEVTDVERPIKKWRFVWGSKEIEEKEGDENLYEGTIYSLNLIPLGGFVRIKGEDGENIDPDSFGSKKIWQRVLVLVAGVTMNFLLASLLLGIGLINGLPQAVDSLDKGAIITDHKIEVMAVLPGSPADTIGMQLGDQIIALGNTNLNNVGELQKYFNENKGNKVQISFKRGESLLQKEIIPEELAETKRGGIGVSLLESGVVSYPWYLAIPKGFKEAGVMSWEILKSFGVLISQLVQGNGEMAQQMSGPVGIAVLTGRAARLGFSYLLQFAALLSLNLAILNILPIPALDGGRVLFLVVEKIRGRALRKQLEGIIHTAGFALLMLMVIFVTYKDFVRFGGSFVRLGKKIIGG